jgi:Asp-tRNA(Asn)/Glu-tRNA(Gln) amidotransferase A subunit family amidase
MVDRCTNGPLPPSDGCERPRQTAAGDELTWLSARELLALMTRRVVSPVEVVDAFLASIDRHNALYNAYVDVLADEARATAVDREKALISGASVGALHGLPIAIKDYEPRVGVRNTCGAMPLLRNIASETAPCIERLERAGAIVLGTTNTPELGHKATTDNLLWGPTSTPFRPGMNSGGSSGGSASAVAGGLAVLAQGGDGGGSVRVPAAMCGVFGMKPSWGRIPIKARPNGFIDPPRASVGPFARTVRDGALMLKVMAGPSNQDPSCLPDLGDDLERAADLEIARLRVAYSPDLDVFPVERAVQEVVERAVAALADDAGVEAELVSLGLGVSHGEMAEVLIREIAVAKAGEVEALASAGFDLLVDNGARLPDRLRRLIDLGRSVSALDYHRGGAVKTQVFDAFERIFERWDVLVTPTIGIVGVPNEDNGETIGPAVVDGTAVDPTLGWCLTYPLNFTGHPAASVPAGLTDDGLPVGLQVIGPRWRDDIVIAVSAALERVKPWTAAYSLVRDSRDEAAPASCSASSD